MVDCGKALYDIICTYVLVMQIHFEDFRMFSESFGMQLDDDSLLALYHVYDPSGR
jgi:hypothetical protein